jgi:hypothetical protein
MRARRDSRGINGQAKNGWHERDESSGSDSELHGKFQKRGHSWGVVVVTNGEG